MKILVTGATGLLGRQICLKLLERGDELVVVSTKPEQKFRESFSYPCEHVHWDHIQQIPDVDGVIHLAGDNIASGRWSAKKKRSILESRTEPTQKLIEALEKKSSKPKVFVSTSAIGVYGDRGNEILSEDSDPGQGFLADVCKAWEASAMAIKPSTRLVILRVGIVLDTKGGFLGRMEPLFSSQLGGKAGSGKQWMSWIHHEDLINMYLHCLDNNNVEGVYNAVAPKPVTNAHFTKAFASQLGVLSVFSAPSFGLKIGLGEMAQLALASQNVLAEKITQTGFQFQHPELEGALKHLYAWKKKANQQMFYSEQWISQSRDKVFPFFSEARNLEKITPPFLNFRILKSSTDPIQKGTLIDYRLKIHGVPARWRTEIQQWQPNEMFVDRQLKGPYSQWNHTHSFTDLKGGTLMRDEVIYKLPLGTLGLIVAGFFVRKDVESIFGYRTKVIHQMDGSFQ